jgi:hypothetical protein|tara:strand:- start:205 stop:849 length:645 start_codon:yes stop_codon:yes gene_type:complete
MSTFKEYLAEASQSYDYKIKIAGEPKDIDKNALETALQKFDLAKMSAGKSTPIMSVPLDFPRLSNESVTIFDVTTNYPATSHMMQEYLSDILRIPATHIVVRKPGEPTEEYQDDLQVAKKSEFANKLDDVEKKFQDHPVKGEDHYGDKHNMSLMRELLKTRDRNLGEISKGTDNKTQDVMPNEDDKTAKSPINTGPGPVKGNPVPTHPFQGFKA